MADQCVTSRRTLDRSLSVESITSMATADIKRDPPWAEAIMILECRKNARDVLRIPRISIVDSESDLLGFSGSRQTRQLENAIENSVVTETRSICVHITLHLRTS
jgi:hypothetical protein